MRIASSHQLVLAAFTVFVLGCGGDAKPRVERKPDADAADPEGPDAGSDPEQDAGQACVKVPEHSAIINADTDSEKVDKEPVLPLLKSDGTLPPLP